MYKRQIQNSRDQQRFLLDDNRQALANWMCEMCIRDSRVPTSAGATSFEIETNSEMCPNIYVNVSLIQPHKNRNNDKPIRLYGVLNINIDDPNLRLTPKINMAQELRPSQDFTVTVSEKDGKPMTYSIAIDVYKRQI